MEKLALDATAHFENTVLLFIQWVWANTDITQHKHKKVR